MYTSTLLPSSSGFPLKGSTAGGEGARLDWTSLLLLLLLLLLLFLDDLCLRKHRISAAITATAIIGSAITAPREPPESGCLPRTVLELVLEGRREVGAGLDRVVDDLVKCSVSVVLVLVLVLVAVVEDVERSVEVVLVFVRLTRLNLCE